MSSENFDVHRILYSQMSSQNSKCPAKDWQLAGQNVRRSSNEFRILWTVYEIDNKGFLLVLAYQKRLLIKAGLCRAHPNHIQRDPFIIFHSVRKSNFCTEILIKLRPLAIARTSLIYAFLLHLAS